MTGLLITLACALAATAEPPPDTAVAAVELEVYFEAKLLVRRRAWGRRWEVDQWNGGRVRMRGEPDGAATVYRISEVLEAPWTFRWYPSRDEVKLGAAVWVEKPSGDPYGSLAPRLEPLAREKHALWWDADPAAAGPEWAAQSGRFWARRHRREQAEKDALPEHPTYPFHVLGPIDDRFGFTVRDGAVGDVVETMTQPWLRDGWDAALSGEDVLGYGFWDSERPRWEPRTYETFAAALGLLRETDSEEALQGAWSVITAMQPWAGRFGGDRLVQPRQWRNRGAGTDEVQLLLTDGGDETFKFWVRVGYREAPRRKP